MFENENEKLLAEDQKAGVEKEFAEAAINIGAGASCCAILGRIGPGFISSLITGKEDVTTAAIGLVSLVVLAGISVSCFGKVLKAIRKDSVARRLPPQDNTPK